MKEEKNKFLSQRGCNYMVEWNSKDNERKLNSIKKSYTEENSNWNENGIEKSMTQSENSGEILARRMDQEEDRISGPQRFTPSQSAENKWPHCI